DEVNANLVGEHGLLHNVANHLRVRQRLPAARASHVAEGVEAEFQMCGHSGIGDRCLQQSVNGCNGAERGIVQLFRYGCGPRVERVQFTTGGSRQAKRSRWLSTTPSRRCSVSGSIATRLSSSEFGSASRVHTPASGNSTRPRMASKLCGS